VTYIDRATRCIMNWTVTFERSDEVLQDLLDDTQPARWYYSDAALVYAELLYPETHFMMSDKSQTFSVEGVNAELRHYLARLVRRSPCFSRCPLALHCAVCLFVFCSNLASSTNSATQLIPLT
jgi:IS1 family transposase